jgi:hypothetical protein
MMDKRKEGNENKEEELKVEVKEVKEVQKVTHEEQIEHVEEPVKVHPTVYAERIQAIAKSSVLADIFKAMRPNQHYVTFPQDGREVMTLTRDGWNLIGSVFGITINVLEDSTTDIYELPGEYTLLRDSYSQNIERWIRGELPEDAPKKLKVIADRLSTLYASEVRPTKKFSLRIKVRVEFIHLSDSDPLYFREDIGCDIVDPGEYRTEHFKLLTRVCNRAIRNMTGGLLGGQIVGSDEEQATSTARNTR